jgi:predicted RNase H-like HicB family nuclease
MAERTFTAVIHLEADLYVADCPEVGTVSQGKTIEEAVRNLQEATELYLEEFPLPDSGKPLLTTSEAKYAGEIGCVIRLHDELAVGTLRSVLRQSQVNPEQFIASP